MSTTLISIVATCACWILIQRIRKWSEAAQYRRWKKDKEAAACRRITYRGK